MNRCPHLRSAVSSQQGSVFVLVAVAAMMLIASTGVAVDMARAQVLQSKIQTALDAAGLAAGATANSIDIQTQAQKYFDANFQTGYLGAGKVTVVATMNATNSVVTLTADTTQATTFMKAIGVNSVKVAANSQVTRANLGMELVLVLDNTGSMGNAVNPSDSGTSKLEALQSSIVATGGLLDILYGTNDTIPNLWVGVVPFSDMVNIGPGHSAWMDATYDSTLDYGPTVGSYSCPSFGSTSGTHNSSPSRCTYSILTSQTQPTFGLTNWGGCVTARSATTTSPTDATLTLDASDDYPSTSSTLFQAFFYPSTSSTASSTDKCSGGSNAWKCSRINGSGSSRRTYTTYNAVDHSSGGNANCLSARVMGMTASKTNVVSEINTLVADGSTMINLGLAWGYRMLSPGWAGKWGGEMDATGNSQFPELPLDYHTALMNKVVILMTDGINSTGSQSAYIGQSTPSNTKLDTNTKAICDAMKKNGIIIYTIGFGMNDDNDASDPSSVDGPLLKYCATQNYAGDTSHYFLAPTNAQLAGVFQQIGNSLANLRVSQ